MRNEPEGRAGVPRFARPYDTAALDTALRERGAIILSGLYSPQQCATFLGQLEDYLSEHPEESEYAARSILGGYQGETTETFHALVGAVDSAAEMVIQEDLLGCARRVLAPLSTGILMTVAEYMARHPGQLRQDLHRDSYAWMHVPIGEHPVALTVMAAMSDFTAQNGATWVVLDSQRMPMEAGVPEWEDAVQAEMRQGDALMFRADLFHAGGANATDDDVRRIFSTGYQVGWLRTVENSSLSVPPDVAARLPGELQELLGYSNELVLGLYKGGDPKQAFPLAVGAD